MTFIKKRFDAELLFTDRDSLAYDIKSEDVYEKIFKHKYLFDFSNYSKDSKIFDETDEFFGLMSKVYSMKNIDGKESNTAKVVNIASEFSEFKATLFNRKVLRHKMRRVQGKKHKMETCKIKKTSLL